MNNFYNEIAFEKRKVKKQKETIKMTDLFNLLLEDDSMFGVEDALFEPFHTEEFEIGQYVEVGFGESLHDSEGYSRFFLVDIEGYNGDLIAEIFDQRGQDDDVLYVLPYPDNDAEERCQGMKLSDYLKQV